MRIIGHYSKGCGKAHTSAWGHTPVFGQTMMGTFNVKTKRSIRDFPPTIISEQYGRQYWRVQLNGKYEAWAFRWDGSHMPLMTWELVSREMLPAELKHGEIIIEIDEGKGV